MKNVFFIMLLCFSFALQAQQTTKYSKVRIDLTNHEISELGVLGIEIEHGLFQQGKHFVNILSAEEIARIQAAGIPFKIETADATADYLRKAAEDGHNHEAESARVNNCDTGNGGGPTYDYDTPVNYTTGSMGGYMTYEEYLAAIDDMVAKYPNLVKAKQQIGSITTEENRPIYWLKISDNPNVDEDEPEVLYTALHHAREPNSLSQLIFFMWYTLENYETDPEIKFLLDNTELYFVPMVNPDGYVYNQTTDPNGGGFWRKNRWKDDNGQAFGVDLNRNYGHEWGFDNQGSSNDPSSGTYRGPSAFSEPESQALKQFCESHQFQLALNYHTFGNLLIHPWGFSDMPTAEDESFKTMGHVLNIENNFKLGTGTQTVGYVVNGDSDDYMYGEQTAKNKIYAYTPEVGHAFWPQQSEIDNLNKSNVRMNINLGLLAHNKLIVTDESPLVYSEFDNQLSLKLKQAGLASGSNTVTVTSTDPNVISIGAPVTTSFNHLQEEIVNIDFSIDPNINSLIEVEFTITIDNGAITESQTITKTIITGSTVITSISDIISPDDFMASGSWGITNEDFVSPPASYTDSPNLEYDSGRNDHVIYAHPLDLSESVFATLNFEAKWDIENDYDFVQIVVGTNPNIETMAAQCGIFTNSGSNDQIPGAPLYDGTQEEWVSEKINLEDFIGEDKVYFGFKFISDGFINADGFYFDDIVLESILDTDTKTDEFAYNNSVSIEPNPTSNAFKVNLGAEFPKDNPITFQLIDITGKIVLTDDLNDSKMINIEQMPNGIYQLFIADKTGRLASKKVVKVQ